MFIVFFLQISRAARFRLNYPDTTGRGLGQPMTTICLDRRIQETRPEFTNLNGKRRIRYSE